MIKKVCVCVCVCVCARACVSVKECDLWKPSCLHVDISVNVHKLVCVCIIVCTLYSV